LIRLRSVTSVAAAAFLCLPAVAAFAVPAPKAVPQTAVPLAEAVDAKITTPRAFLGFTPGDDDKLANYKQSYTYFHQIVKQTGRMRLFDAGKTAMGEPMMVAIISSEKNLARLDRLKTIAKTLAEGNISESEARSLAKEGRTMVWIDGGMHATEVGSAQHTINLGYDLIARNDAEFQTIRDKCVVILVPSINPDGQNLVADWFNKNYGTPQEGTALPVLYQKYAGHDNNRDWYMLNLPETRNMTHLLYEEWFPQIVYNHHQAPSMYPERMFVPPYDDPMNPNIPPLVMRGINAVGTAMHTRFEEEGKTGIISLDTYSAWWNGGMRTTPFFHNIIGILTEVAHASPYPVTYKTSVSQQEPTAWYPNPYKGGTWHFADTVAYMNTGSMGLLNWAAQNAESIQTDRWRMAHTAIMKGEQEAPYGFIFPLDTEHQHDPNTAAVFLERMRLSGLEVRLAQKTFTENGVTYPAGTAVILSSQANRPQLMDMVLPQNHPMRRQGPNGPPIPPYDIAGWTLTLQMGVTTVPMTTKPTADLIGALNSPETKAIVLPRPASFAAALSGGSYLLPTERNTSFVAVNRLLAAKIPVSRWTSAQTINGTKWVAGTFAVPATEASRKALASIASDLRLPVTAVPNPASGGGEISLAAPRVATYDPYGGNIAQGWTQYVLENFEFPHVTVTNPDLRTGGLNKRLDTLILPAFPNVKTRATGSRTSASSKNPTAYSDGGMGPGFLGGAAPKSLAPEVAARLEGIGETGQANLRQFVQDGGTLVALDSAAESVIELFGLPVSDVTSETKFYSPGSVFRVEVNPEDPLCWGLTKDMNIFFDKGTAWEVKTPAGNAPQGGSFAVYPDKNPLLSGWIIEDQVIRNRAAAVTYRIGKGKVVVFGFDVTFRGQPYMGFPLLFNALYPVKESK
jgi:hypothetical protein